jgi:hypothetical protein
VAEWLAADGVRVPVAGGSWLRAEAVRWLPPGAKEEDVGFRCAFDAR